MKRREFVKTLAATGVALYASDLMGDLMAQTPRARVLESKFKGMSDIALGDAKRLGCSYADIRFSRNISDAVGLRDRIVTGGGGFGGGGFGGGGREESAGFGVRVIHSGVWGFASSPIVTEDEIKRITKIAAEVARSSAIAKKNDVRLAPVPAYQVYWATPIGKNPDDMPRETKQDFVQKVVDAAVKNKGVQNVSVSVNTSYEWKYFASSEGSYIEQESWQTSPSFSVTARKDDIVRTRNFTAISKMGGWEVAEEAKMLENAERIAAEAVEFTTARPVDMGVKDLILTPSHAMLTIHEIVAHATELDRIMGYEANYAGTSFVKVSDLNKLKYGSKLFNVTCDKTIPGGLGTIGYDDDGVKTTKFPIVREGILVGLMSNRETAHYINDKESRGCTYASSWRDYPFLRMGNVHVEPGAKGSPTLEQMIADTKDGVMIDGRGSYSIDQQRYNGQFGGNAFWEIKNGKKTRMVTNVTYNAITTDFWANLDALTGPDEWEMHGTGGDAKGQPTQTNSISHGSPYLRIKKMMVGAAFA
jgi:TldD protein